MFLSFDICVWSPSWLGGPGYLHLVTVHFQHFTDLTHGGSNVGHFSMFFNRYDLERDLLGAEHSTECHGSYLVRVACTVAHCVDPVRSLVGIPHRNVLAETNLGEGQVRRVGMVPFSVRFCVRSVLVYFSCDFACPSSVCRVRACVCASVPLSLCLVRSTRSRQGKRWQFEREREHVLGYPSS